MPTVNETILDLEIRHQIGIQRLSTSVLLKLIPILNKADAEIVAKLSARGATLEGSFTSKRLEKLLEAIWRINRDAHVILGRELRKELREIAAYEASFQQNLLSRAIPVEIDIVTPSVEQLEAIVTARPFQGKLLKDWLSELEQGRARRVRDAIRLGMVEGETVDQIVRRIRGTRAQKYRDGIMEIGRRGAEAMVRTAVAHTASVAREKVYEANKNVIAKEMWAATLDTRTCLSCQSLDRKEFEIGKGPKTPRHIACRCVRIPVTKSFRELGIDLDEIAPSTRASMDGQVPATMSYSEWLRKQPASVQDEALGPTRAKLFREGGLDIDRFVNRAGDEWTLDELRQRDAEAFKRAGLAA